MPSLRSLLRPLAFVLALALVLTACGNAFHRPAAVVGGASITDDGLQAEIPLAKVFASLQGQSCGSPVTGESARSACLRFALGFLVTQRVVEGYAADHNLRVSITDVRQAITRVRSTDQSGRLDSTLHHFGVSARQFEGLVHQLLLLTKTQEDVAAHRLTDQQLRAAYDQRKSDFTLLHAAHILVGSKQLADRIAGQVTTKNFADLAKRYSTDQGSAQHGGDLGEVSAGQLDSDFVRAALALKPGQISDPVQTRFGWHIIRLISVRLEPFEQARQQLVSQLAGPVFQQWLQQRLRAGDIKVNPRYGRFDPGTGQVVPLNSTGTGLPAPSASAGLPTP